MSANPKVRVDLVRRQIEMGDSLRWVVYDPIAGSYFHFSQEEYDLLMLADGTRDIAEIYAKVSSRSPDQIISKQSIANFFHQVKVCHLLEGAGGQTEVVASPWWSRLLAVRFPGVSPDRLLERLDFLTPCFFSPWSWRLLWVLGPLALLLTFSRLDVWMKEVANATLTPTTNWIVVAIAVSIAKLVHETAHALACRHVRCDCREVGVMLLCGIPCMYVDVSDAWLLRKTRDRMLVSAAGILAECWIATLATFFWLATDSGVIHHVSIVLMLVCSVSTLLINGNPLLRYDGYYLLSDATGTPNLASESRRILRGWFDRRNHWGGEGVAGVAMGRAILMSIYAALSMAYRVVILAVIVGLLYSAANSIGLGAAVVGAIALGLASKLVRLLRQNRSRNSVASPSGLARISWLLGAACIVAGCLIPLPRFVVAPADIVAAGSQDVFVSTAGYLTEDLRHGATVADGQSLVQLYNGETQRKHAEAVSQQSVWQTRLRVFQQTRHVNSQWSEQIPAIAESLRSSTDRVDLLTRQASSLDVRSPVTGVFYPPPSPSPSISTVSYSSDSTKVQMKKSFKSGMWLPVGTVLGSVGHAHAREAVALVDQSQVALLRDGQAASLILKDHGKRAVTGIVVAISPSPVERHSNGLTLDPQYRVRIRIANGDRVLPVHRKSKVAIEVDRASVWDRMKAALRESFGGR
ncbi:HlyD family efflux transporter periplasmic adaptor subunit [Rubripirellula amarantea]|nr:HlyD family efflux transporter periplasmic adaptor subunit [Rubripirellula amarantea]